MRIIRIRIPPQDFANSGPKYLLNANKQKVSSYQYFFSDGFRNFILLKFILQLSTKEEFSLVLIPMLCTVPIAGPNEDDHISYLRNYMVGIHSPSPQVLYCVLCVYLYTNSVLFSLCVHNFLMILIL